MKYYNLQNNFTGGEVTPLLSARSDIQKYNNSCAELLNVIPQIYGGVKKRGGLRFVHNSNVWNFFNGHAQPYLPVDGFLMPFYFDKDNSYIVHAAFAKNASGMTLTYGTFIHSTSRVYADSSGDPIYYNYSTNYLDNLYTFAPPANLIAEKSGTFRFSRLTDALLVMSDRYFPTYLRRLSGSQWTNQQFYFSLPPLGKYFYRPSTAGFSGLTLTLSSYNPNAVPQTVTVTANQSFFVSGDNGREITMLNGSMGRLLITGVSSGTTATAIVYEPFSSNTLQSALVKIDTASISNNVSITVPAHTVNGGVTISIADTTRLYRPSEFGYNNTPRAEVYISANNGLFRIISTNNTTTTNFVCTVIKQGDANTVTVTVPSNAWDLYAPIYIPTDNIYSRPDALSFYQQRLFFSGSFAKASKLVGSSVGGYSDFEIGSKETDAVDFEIAEISEKINHLIQFRADLVAFTGSGVYAVKGGVEAAISATNVSISKLSDIGAGDAIPQIIYNEIYYVDVTGKRLLSAVYDSNLQSYTVNNESKLAEHVTQSGIKQLAYQATPNSTLWVLMNDGSLASVTIDKTEGIVGWARHDFGYRQDVAQKADLSGKLISIACVYHAIKKIDVLYVLYSLDIKYGKTLPMLCMLDDDCELDFCYKASSSTAKKLWNLPKEYYGVKVSVISDNVYIGNFVVYTDNLDENNPNNAWNYQTSSRLDLIDNCSSISVGFKFDTKIQLLPITGSGQDGSFDHKNIKIGQVAIKCHKTLGAKFNGEFIGGSRYDYSVLNANLYDFNAPLNPSALPPSKAPFTSLPKFTGKYVTTKLGWNTTDDDNPRDPEEVEKITITQDLPYPLHILSVMRRVTVN